MSPAEAHRALIERTAAAAGIEPGVATVYVEEEVEVVLRRLFSGLLEHDEIAETLPLIEGAASNAAVAVLTGGPGATAGFIGQMIAFGVLLGKGRS